MRARACQEAPMSANSGPGDDRGAMVVLLCLTLLPLAFWLLGLAFAMIALNHGALITHLLPLLHDRAVQSEVAVVRPLIDVPNRMIAPAPRKPMPEMTWAARRAGSPFGA